LAPDLTNKGRCWTSTRSLSPSVSSSDFSGLAASSSDSASLVSTTFTHISPKIDRISLICSGAVSLEGSTESICSTVTKPCFLALRISSSTAAFEWSSTERSGGFAGRPFVASLFCGAALILLAMLLTTDAEPALDPRPQVFFKRCRTVTARPWELSLLGFAPSTRGFQLYEPFWQSLGKGNACPYRQIMVMPEIKNNRRSSLLCYGMRLIHLSRV
jgi:hypothetical protein